jgi:hypothetical protein
MNLNTVRRAQLIAPFGPGALMVLRNGVSVITAGLDHWFCTNADSNGDSVDPKEYKLTEWRLQRELKVDYFMQPPDSRRPQQHSTVRIKNANLTVPMLRFPTWNVCRFCNRMHNVQLSHAGHVFCPECLVTKKKSLRMSQVRFIAVCDDGHIQDFPWREWVHRSATPDCLGALKFESRGGSSLNAIRISCTACKRERGLGGIMQETAAGSMLSNSLEAAEGERASSPYLCRGMKPWLGADTGCTCSRPLLGALRSATNVHFGEIQSAIYLPAKLMVGTHSPAAAAITILRDPEFSPLMTFAKASMTPLANLLPVVRSNPLLAKFTDADLEAALAGVLGLAPPAPALDVGIRKVEADDRWTAFRRVEFNVLRRPQSDRDLSVIGADLTKLTSTDLRGLLAAVNLVEKVKETRVFTGFSRLAAGGGPSEEQKMADLRITLPPEGQRWLPAYTVFGEGLFLVLNEERLAKWEERKDVQARVKDLNGRMATVLAVRRQPPEEVTPRLVLVHTLSHLLINRLVYECGYSSASLRERLFVSSADEGPMAGVLIYTASGDSEGSLGGLVRMGRPENLERVLLKALSDARWCSNDPICMESARAGQGPESLNLAACHSCGLLPETSCERFNRLLDRGVVVGSFENPLLGFFSGVVSGGA